MKDDRFSPTDNNIEFRLTDETGILVGPRAKEWVESDSIVILTDWR